jgi:hypothetical protein
MTNIYTKIAHFLCKEFACKCGCGRVNMDEGFLLKLEHFRADIYKKPMIVTRGGSCIKHNKRVGGVKNSLHINENKKATAVDITVNGTAKDMLNLYTTACKSGLFNEIEYHKTLKIVHIGCDPNQIGNWFRILEY